MNLEGIPISPGYAIGATRPWRLSNHCVEKNCRVDEENVKDELDRIRRAIDAVGSELKRFADHLDGKLDHELAGVFRAQRAILLDDGLKKELEDELRREFVCAECVVDNVFRRLMSKFSKLREDHLRLFAIDIEDVGRRLITALRGLEERTCANLAPGDVVVAEDVFPSDTVLLSERMVSGIVVEKGGRGSHAALLAQGFGIPAVAGVSGITKGLKEGEIMLVDGFSGRIVVDPRADELDDFRAKSADRVQRRQIIRGQCHTRAVTRDGVGVSVMANARDGEDAKRAMMNGADGIGLLRMEDIFMRFDVLPDHDALFEQLSRIAVSTKGKPLIVRLLDIGGDKPLDYIPMATGKNPQLGRRGVRLLRDLPRLLELQVNALLRLRVENDNVSVLIPMVTVVEDLFDITDMFQRVAGQMSTRSLPRLGVMIETPAAALRLRDFLPFVDFISLGTNDLTQYVMAADRADPKVSDYYLDSHPAMLTIIRMVIDAAGEKDVAICGNLAAKTAMIPVLLSMGLRSLSVPTPLVPEIKEVVRKVDLTKESSRGLSRDIAEALDGEKIIHYD